MAQPIVDGLKRELGEAVDLVHLNLLSPVGRAAARAFGVTVVPVTLLFDGQGQLVTRQTGLPDRHRLAALLGGQGDSDEGEAAAPLTP